MTEKIKLKFDEEGIEIPYPQMTVHMTKEGNGEENTVLMKIKKDSGKTE